MNSRRVLACVLAGLVQAQSVLAQDDEQQALTDNEDYQSFKSWARNTKYPDPLPNMFKFCIEAYDRMIASGISPDTRVPDEMVPGFNYGDPDIPWTGTVKEIKESWCEAGGKKVAGEVADRLAPYKKALKGDKYDLVVSETHGQITSYALEGGKYTDDAEKLAEAQVWFLDVGAATNEKQYCNDGGARKKVRKYTFDDDQNLLDTTETQFCGDPPSSAYH